jgi:hypothetical protein
MQIESDARCEEAQIRCSLIYRRISQQKLHKRRHAAWRLRDGGRFERSRSGLAVRATFARIIAPGARRHGIRRRPAVLVNSTHLSRFEGDPDKFEAGLKSTIQEKVQADPAFAAELKSRIDEIGPEITVFQRVKDSKNVVGIDSDAQLSGRNTVAQDAERVDNLTGVHVKTRG